jgi:hypothetical protein
MRESPNLATVRIVNDRNCGFLGYIVSKPHIESATKGSGFGLKSPRVLPGNQTSPQE